MQLEREKVLLDYSKTENNLFRRTGVVSALKKVAAEKGLKTPVILRDTMTSGTLEGTERTTRLMLCWDWWKDSDGTWAFKYISVGIWGIKRMGESDPDLAILGKYRGEGNCYLGGGILPISDEACPISAEQMERIIIDAISHPEFESTPVKTGPRSLMPWKIRTLERS